MYTCLYAWGKLGLSWRRREAVKFIPHCPSHRRHRHRRRCKNVAAAILCTSIAIAGSSPNKPSSCHHQSGCCRCRQSLAGDLDSAEAGMSAAGRRRVRLGSNSAESYRRGSRDIKRPSVRLSRRCRSWLVGPSCISERDRPLGYYRLRRRRRHAVFSRHWRDEVDQRVSPPVVTTRRAFSASWLMARKHAAKPELRSRNMTAILHPR